VVLTNSFVKFINLIFDYIVLFVLLENAHFWHLNHGPILLFHFWGLYIRIHLHRSWFLDLLYLYIFPFFVVFIVFVVFKDIIHLLRRLFYFCLLLFFFLSFFELRKCLGLFMVSLTPESPSLKVDNSRNNFTFFCRFPLFSTLG
jgi:hypothetical protein